MSTVVQQALFRCRHIIHPPRWEFPWGPRRYTELESFCYCNNQSAISRRYTMWVRNLFCRIPFPAVYVFRARRTAGYKNFTKTCFPLHERSCISPVFCFRGVHAARIIPRDFLRGLPCRALVAGYTARVIKVDGTYSPQ